MLQYQACTTYSFQVTKVDSIKYYSLDLYALLWRLNLHAFDYTVVTHVNVSLRRWDLYHCLQYEIRIQYIYSLFLKYKRKLPNSGYTSLKRLNKCEVRQCVNKRL